MDYYNKKYVVHEIIKLSTDRDFSALSKSGANIRALRVKCLFDFERALKVINWEKNKQNLYVGCSKLKDIPNFTFNPKNRSSETSEWFRNEYNNQIQSYDLFFDFDKCLKCSCGLTENSENGLKRNGDKFFCGKCQKELNKEEMITATIEEVRIDAKILKDYLDEYNIPYSIIFSGNKGFQVVIDGEYLEIEKIELGNVYPHKIIQENIKKMLNLEYCDSANVGISSRLRKLPYSLVSNGEENETEMNVALPLDDFQFEGFKLENVKLKSVLSSIKLIRRGNLERFQNLSFEEKRKNLKSFIRLFEFR
ncbi:MAG TPA: hypothetical protein VGB37_14710 [Candidatus Lokiarchaeia archaeon]